MAEDKESVLDEKSTQKSNGASFQLSSIALVLAIATLAFGVLIAILAQFVSNFDVIRVLNCIAYIIYAVTVAFYLLDVVKFKNFAINPTLFAILISTIILF